MSWSNKTFRELKLRNMVVRINRNKPSFYEYKMHIKKEVWDILLVKLVLIKGELSKLTKKKSLNIKYFLVKQLVCIYTLYVIRNQIW